MIDVCELRKQLQRLLGSENFETTTSWFDQALRHAGRTNEFSSTAARGIYLSGWL